MSLSSLQQRQARKRRIRARISGSALRPRLCIHRSHQTMSVQIIDDAAGKTLFAASTKELGTGKKVVPPTLENATKLGELIAKKAKDAKVESVVFDRSGYKYHGRIKAMADAARAGGLHF